MTRVVSTPLDNQDVGNWACMLGLAALFVEGTLLALSAFATSLAWERQPSTSTAATLNGTAQYGSLVRVGPANGSGG